MFARSLAPRLNRIPINSEPAHHPIVFPETPDTVIDELTEHFEIIVRFGPKGAEPGVVHVVVAIVVAEAVVATEQGLEVEGQPVRWERSHGWVGGVVVLVVGLLLGLGLGLILDGGVRRGEGVCEVVGVE